LHSDRKTTPSPFRSTRKLAQDRLLKRRGTRREATLERRGTRTYLVRFLVPPSFRGRLGGDFVLAVSGRQLAVSGR